MKEKKILPLILSMSLPMMISMAINSLYNIVDSYFVAQISEDAMTALSLVFPVQNIVNAIAIGFGIGINASISFFLGAKKQESANKSATLGILFSILHGIVLTILCIVFLPSFLALFSSNHRITDLALLYGNRILLFTIAVMTGICFEKIFQAVGNMKVAMFSMLCGSIVNLILDPLMIFGIGCFPRLGISGAAYATGIAQSTTLFMYLLIHYKRPLPLQIKLQDAIPDFKLLSRLYRVGIPATLNLALPSLQISILNGILAAFSDQYVMILGIYYKLQTFIYLSANGIVQGIRPLISYNYGAGETKRVKQIFSLSLAFIAGIMLIGTTVSWTLPTQIFSLFTKNPETVLLGSTALKIISLGFIFSSISVLCSGALEALGRGLPSLYISMARYIVIILPLAFLLSYVMGANGVWTAFAVTEAITALFSYWIYEH